MVESKITESKIIETKFIRDKEKEAKDLAESQKRMDRVLNLSIEIQSRPDAPTIWEIIWKLLKASPSLIKLIIMILNFKENFMQDMKTTIGNLVKGLVIILGLIGVSISPENQTAIIEFGLALYAIITVVTGYFTKDATKN